MVTRRLQSCHKNGTLTLHLLEILIFLRVSLAMIEVIEPFDNKNGTNENETSPSVPLVLSDKDTLVLTHIDNLALEAFNDSCIDVSFPTPDCILFTICDGTNPCHHGNCSVIDTYNFSCSCFDGYRSKGPGAPCELNIVSDCDNKQCQQICNQTSTENECSCISGFAIDDDGISCIFDNSSNVVQCDKDCGNGVCLNDSCVCFTGYHHDKNSKCVRIDPCTIPKICGENANCFSSSDHHTCKCKSNYKNISGSCQEINPCHNSSIREQCERYGKHCRSNGQGGYECYCAVPYYPMKDVRTQLESCLTPKIPYHMYNLSMDLIGYHPDDGYSIIRNLENIFINECFSRIINITVLNLEIKTFDYKPWTELAHLTLYVAFAKDVPQLGDTLQHFSAPYPNRHYTDAVILPGMIVIRNSSISYTVLDDVCHLDSQMSEFLCGPFANCQADRTSYKCTCKTGYEVRGYENPLKPLCIDINECLRNNQTCGSRTQICKNSFGNYSCECLPCFIWNEARTDCVFLCQSNPCANNGFCQVNRIQDTCGFQCTCSDEYKGPTCTEINDSVRTSRAAVAITGGVLGGLLGLVIILGIVMIYKFLQRSGYFSFQTAKSRFGL